MRRALPSRTTAERRGSMLLRCVLLVPRRDRGVVALLAGPRGTGKILAAEILANHLRLGVYQIDVAAVVSKYLGETEKNLDRVFQDTEGSGTILFFDEGDALFGQRSEVKDRHDRYANIEVDCLLQRLEDCEGVDILTTNCRWSYDWVVR